MHLSSVGQLDILWRTADGEQVDTETELWPADTVCQAESSQTMEGYDYESGVEGGGDARKSLRKGIRHFIRC